MEAIVLAGGLGTRLRSTVPDLPKAMAPVGARPFLEILLSSLARKGCTRLILSVGHMAEKIQDHFGSRFDQVDIVYEIESKQLGTGGALKRSLARCDSDHVLALNGDTYLDVEVDRLEVLWDRTREPIIVAHEVSDTARYGRLVSSGCRVIGLLEKGAHGPGLINAGYYMLPTNIAGALPDVETFSFEKDFLEPAVGTQPVQLFVSRGAFIDIGVPEDYARAQVLLAAV
jgi:D-glycero-alpha-D-manno-heptose 1-phosphate guanylyltransferase